MNMDLAKVSELLAVVEKCAAHSGKLSAIANAAMTRLLEIDTAIRNEAKDAAAKAAEAQAAAQAPKAIRADTFDVGDEDPATKPPRESETDKLAKANMRRA